MNKSLVAGVALLAGIVIAAPMLAQSADTPPQPDRATPIIPPADQGQRGGMPGGMAGHPGFGMNGYGGPMHDMMMHRTMHASAEQRCAERLARRAGMVAYTVTRLNLTAEQRPLWDKLNTVIQAGTQKQQQLCAALKTGPQPQERTVVDRADWLEQTLAARVQALHEARPALQQLYQALTPEQKAIVDHPFRHG